MWSLADEVGVGVHFCHTMWLVVLLSTGSEPIRSSLHGPDGVIKNDDFAPREEWAYIYPARAFYALQNRGKDAC